MKTGQWHRLDNVFVILLGQSMQFHFADFKTPLAQDLIRFVFPSFTNIYIGNGFIYIPTCNGAAFMH